MTSPRLGLTALALLMLALPLLAPSAAADPLVAPAPAGAPEVGSDKDRDGVPSNVTVRMMDVVVTDDAGWSTTPSKPLVVRIDGDDRDTTQPVPAVHQEPCGGVCAGASSGDTETGVNAHVLPQRECMVGRITLCWYWVVWIDVWHRDENSAQTFSTSPIVLLP